MKVMLNLFNQVMAKMYNLCTGERVTAARSCKDSLAGPAQKIRPLEKNLGRKLTTQISNFLQCRGTI